MEFLYIIWLFITYNIIMLLRLFWISPLRLQYIRQTKSLSELQLIENISVESQCTNLLIWTFDSVKQDIIKRGQPNEPID